MMLFQLLSEAVAVLHKEVSAGSGAMEGVVMEE
jgi:hypothetical protein